MRHNNVEPADVSAMLKTIGVDSLDTLIQQTVPAKIRLEQRLRLPDPKTEFAFLRDFKAMMGQNQIFKSHIGLG